MSNGDTDSKLVHCKASSMSSSDVLSSNKKKVPSQISNQNTSMRPRIQTLGLRKVTSEGNLLMKSPVKRMTPRSKQSGGHRGNGSFNLDDGDFLNKSMMIVPTKPLCLIPSKVGPTAKEIRDLYLGKSPAVVVDTILQFLNDSQTLNKDVHIAQFYTLYQHQEFRMKTELRLRLFLGNHVKPGKAGEEVKTVDSSEGKIDGLIHLIGNFQRDKRGAGRMQADYVIKFLFDLLDFQKSP
mmetsp:Transcript_37568/g.57548  ORF Transcript_37568/g.57548 Transcript_37568/m.57548 type:complete len:238 (-) Transcript_37568:1643-2356(-)